MKTTTNGAVLLALLTTAAASAFADDAPGTTAAQRWAAYGDCEAKANAPGTQLGIAFIVNLATGNAPAALASWATMVIKAHPEYGCLAFLTADERQAQIEQEERMREQNKLCQHGGC